MKITEAHLHELKNATEFVYGDALTMKTARLLNVLEVKTDSGIIGWGDWGESTYTDRPFVPPPDCSPFLKTLVGRKVEDHAQIYAGLASLAGITKGFLSALDMALWDIRAKRAGLSLSNLLGGRFREDAPVYASLQSYREDYPDAIEWILKLVQQALQDGFKQVKMKIGGLSIDEEIECIAQVKKLMSQQDGMDQLPLAVDSNCTYTFQQAVRMGRALDREAGIAWFEEPLPRDDISGYRQLRRKIDTPIAGAEGCQSVREVYELLRQEALDIVQPDVQVLGGVTELIRACHLIDLMNLHTYQHCYFGCLERIVGLHLIAATPPWGSAARGYEAASLEWETAYFPARDELLTTRLTPNAEGKIPVPEGPGLGVEIDRDTIEKYRNR